MLEPMLKNVSHLRAEAEALKPVWTNGTFSVVVRFAVVVLISILISHFHAEPV
jgi:hypothetical protein